MVEKEMYTCIKVKRLKYCSLVKYSKVKEYRYILKWVEKDHAYFTLDQD